MAVGPSGGWAGGPFKPVLLEWGSCELAETPRYARDGMLIQPDHLNARR